ncbi:snRNA-activating protein complex subunit 1-like, partial, partial [Argonauta hians]
LRLWESTLSLSLDVMEDTTTTTTTKKTDTTTTTTTPKVKYIAAGVQADFEVLFNRFAKCRPLNFVEFARVWRQMKLSLLCMGRQTEREARQLMEEALLIALHYFHSPYTFEVKAGAFFLLYGLYCTQFFTSKVRIRCTLSDWEEMNTFIKEAMGRKMTDVEFIFHRLCVLKAFLYVASPNNVRQGDVTSDQCEDLVNTLSTKQPSVMDQLYSTESIQELSALHNQYQRVKALLYDPTSMEYQSINMLEVNTADKVVDILSKFHKEKPVSTAVTTQPDEESILSRRKKLKGRPYGVVNKDTRRASNTSTTTTTAAAAAGRASGDS